MNEKDLALFKMKAIRSKKELIKAVNNYLVRAERSSLPAMDQTVESLELVREFKTRIEGYRQESCALFRQPHKPAVRCGYPSSRVTSR